MDFDFRKEPGRKLLDRGLSHDGKPLISIITPYYNAGKYIMQTFNCVMNQTFPWFEWIIVNDGSTDQESLRELERTASLDDRIRIISQDNKGLSAARNAGVEATQTDIFVPLDADDLIMPTYLEYVYWALYFHPHASWAYTDSCGFAGLEYLWRVPFSADGMCKQNTLVCTAAIRKKAFEAIGGYYSSGKYFNEDWHFWLRLLGKGMYPVHTCGYLFWYRRSEQGMRQAIQQDRILRKQSLQLIKKAAENVKTNVTAIEYPSNGMPNKFSRINVSLCDRKVYADHNKIHILMMIPWMVMGGADLFNLDICKGIDKERFEIGIITTQASENAWQQRFEEYVTEIFNLPEFLDTANWAEFISYYIRSREVNVLFVSNSYPAYYLVPWLRKEFPLLAIIDYVHMEEWYWRSGGYARISGVVGHVLEKTYVCNERTMNVFIKDFGRDKDSVETLYIGVDHNKYDATEVKAGLAKSKLGIKPERRMVLFPCRVHPQKRPFLMFEIARETKKHIPDISFVVVGDGVQLKELEMEIEKNEMKETIYLAGRQDDMLPWYKDCDITLICSLKEGLALTAYESLSMGKPVITSDVGGQRELVDEEVGRVIPLLQDEEKDLDKREFDPKEVDQYVRAIIDILENEKVYMTMSKACRSRIEKRFSSQIMIRKLEDIFENLVRNGNNKREIVADMMRQNSSLISELPVLYNEIIEYESSYMSDESSNKRELVRLANTKWGRRAIKLMLKLKLNKLFK